MIINYQISAQGTQKMERSFSFLGFCLILSLQVCQNVATTIELEVLQARIELMDKTITDLVKKDLQQQEINRKQTDINQQLQTTIDDLQDVITRLLEDNRDYGKTISQLTESLSKQQTTISKLKKKHSLPKSTDQETNKITVLERQETKSRSKSEEKTTLTIAPKQTNIKEPTHIQDESIRARDIFDGQHKRLVLSNESPVAFMASVSKQLNNLGHEQTIIFDAAQLNLGNGYHNLNGVFTVPKSGIYIFSANVMFDDTNSQDAFVAIVKNGVEIASLYSRGADHIWDQGSQTIIVQANQTDQVYVRTKAFINIRVYPDNASTFSGYLLYSL